MINPSAQGWISKFLSQQILSAESFTDSTDDFYLRLRATGFIYGHSVQLDTQYPVSTRGWQYDELSKVALLNALYSIFKIQRQTLDTEEFVKQILNFYNQMNPQGFDLFKRMLPKSSPVIKLEKIIDERVRTNDNFISKNFSHIVTNALLFVDVLAFHKFLTNGAIPEKYLKKTEEIVLSVISLALKTKTDKSPHDSLLVKLFETSVRYTKFSKSVVTTEQDLNLDYITSSMEKYYLIDLAGMAMWSDGQIERTEVTFLSLLADKLNVPRDFVSRSIIETDKFINKYRKSLPYFNYSNPIKHFYDRMTQSVIVLISRNKTRLIKEIRQSGELMVLLAQSTRRDLSEKEKKKVKKQLLEICKTIPSLTIFLLPGGSLLLPILIKFIPQMLPSAFNENSVNE